MGRKSSSIISCFITYSLPWLNCIPTRRPVKKTLLHQTIVWSNGRRRCIPYLGTSCSHVEKLLLNTHIGLVMLSVCLVNTYVVGTRHEAYLNTPWLNTDYFDECDVYTTRLLFTVLISVIFGSNIQVYILNICGGVF